MIAYDLIVNFADTFFDQKNDFLFGRFVGGVIGFEI